MAYNDLEDVRNEIKQSVREELAAGEYSRATRDYFERELQRVFGSRGTGNESQPSESKRSVQRENGRESEEVKSSPQAPKLRSDLETALFGEASGNDEAVDESLAEPRILRSAAYPFLEDSDFDADGNVKPEVAKEIAAERAKIEKDAKADGTWLKAPNGKDSNLNPAQWVDVRTKRFKKWFGDWLRFQQKRFLEGEPVFSIDVNRFEKDATPSNIAKFYQDTYNGKVSRPDLGEVELTVSGIRHSIVKGASWFKIAAFEAVPSVIQKGMVIDAQKDWGGKGSDTYTISAPITIQGKENIVSVVVKQDGRGNRFKVHRVDLVEHLRQNASYKSSAAKSKATSAPAGDVKSILQNIFAVNENDVSKVVDENGEPLVVYHGTGGDFDAFDFTRTTDVDLSSGQGAYLTTSPVASGVYATGVSWGHQSNDRDIQPNILPVFLNIRKPFNKNEVYRLADFGNLPALDDIRNIIKSDNEPSQEWLSEMEQSIDDLLLFADTLENGNAVTLVDEYADELGYLDPEDYEKGTKDEDYIADANSYVSDGIKEAREQADRYQSQVEAAWDTYQQANENATLEGHEIWDAIKKSLPEYHDLQAEKQLFGGSVHDFLPDTQVAEILADEFGFDGVRRIDRFPLQHGRRHTVFIANASPNQIKSATGNAGTYSGDQDSILRQIAVPSSTAKVSDLGFFSQAEQTVLSAKQDKFSADQVRALLSPKNGVKAEEVAWLDIDSFLADNPKPTKEQVVSGRIKKPGALSPSHRVFVLGRIAPNQRVRIKNLSAAR